MRERVRLLLTLRAMHLGAAMLDAVRDEPMARAVLYASTEGRAWAMKRYRRWCTRGRGAGSRSAAGGGEGARPDA